MGSQSKPIICENELWLHEPKASEDLRSALTWAQKNPSRESSAGDIEKAARAKRNARQTQSE
jgi:hypothetical protein